MSRENDVTSVRTLLVRPASRSNMGRPAPLGTTDVNSQQVGLNGICPTPSLSRADTCPTAYPESTRFLSRSSIVGGTTSSSPQADKRHRDDPRYATEYIKDIMDSLFRAEQRLNRDATYMAQQPELSEKMRMILVDWLVEVHQKFKCRHETLFLAVDIVDRYLAISRTTRSSLQLVGVTAMLLAAKYEEIWPPEVKDCVYISANTYSRDEVLKMERGICSLLQFKLTLPNVLHFLARLLEVMDADTSTRHLAAFYAETSLLNYQMLKYRPSQVAAACVHLAQLTENSADPWSSTLQHYARYRSAEIMDCTRQLLEFAHSVSTSKYTAVKRKYASSKFQEVSNIPLPSNDSNYH